MFRLHEVPLRFDTDCIVIFADTMLAALGMHTSLNLKNPLYGFVVEANPIVAQLVLLLNAGEAALFTCPSSAPVKTPLTTCLVLLLASISVIGLVVTPELFK